MVCDGDSGCGGEIWLKKGTGRSSSSDVLCRRWMDASSRHDARMACRKEVEKYVI